jgi:hypothetical protein
LACRKDVVFFLPCIHVDAICLTGGFEHFQSTIDPEELFRKIFGDAGLGSMGGFSNFADFEESKFGFAPASEVIHLFYLFIFFFSFLLGWVVRGIDH